MLSATLYRKLSAFPVLGWYKSAIRELALNIVTAFGTISQVYSGGVASAGASVTASVLQVSTSAALASKIHGELKENAAALADADILAVAGAVARPTYSNGTTAVGITLTGDQVARVTLIATDSNNSGGATGDNGAALYVAVVAGTSTTYAAATAFLTDGQIADALKAATGVHAGATGFVRLADILWDRNGGSPTATFTVNRSA